VDAQPRSVCCRAYGSLICGLPSRSRGQARVVRRSTSFSAKQLGAGQSIFAN
jgi:hypothetical protein